MRWMIVLSVLLLFGSNALTAEQGSQPRLEGAHAGLECASCHGEAIDPDRSPSSLESRASGCTGCHQGYDRIFDQAMTTRQAEKRFVERTFSEVDPHLYKNNCSSCHVSDCLDCHGDNGHQIGLPAQEECLSCHRDYFVGREYLGMAPREDHPRYQRGKQYLGQKYLKMRPDLHAEAGMECRDCHSMQSFLDGRTSAQGCEDCHQPDPGIIEHSIAGHMEKLECYACHSAWTAQEYGTFYLRMGKNNRKKANDFKAPGLDGEYLRRAYLKKQDSPPLGLNERQKLSPIRPQFIVYYSDLRQDGTPAIENRLLAAEWKAFFPHTIRRGTVMCDSCHQNARRFLLEKEEDRQYRIDLDGLGLSSFWNQAGQTIVNGAFVDPQMFSRISAKNEDYTKAYVEKWKSLIEAAEDSSKE